MKKQKNKKSHLVLQIKCVYNIYQFSSEKNNVSKPKAKSTFSYFSIFQRVNTLLNILRKNCTVAHDLRMIAT